MRGKKIPLAEQNSGREKRQAVYVVFMVLEKVRDALNRERERKKILWEV